MTEPVTLLVGPFGRSALDVVRTGAAAAGHVLEVLDSPDELAGWVGEGVRGLAAVVVDLREAAAGMSAVEVRALPSLASVPIIGLSPHLADAVFQSAYGQGADDCCAVDASALERRLVAVAADPSAASPPNDDKVVVIADTDRNARVLVGRLFRAGGYRIVFATDPAEALRQAADPAAVLVVCSAELELAGEEPLCLRAPLAGSRAAWIVTAPLRELPVVRAALRLGGDTRVATLDRARIAENVLYVANELLHPVPTNLRKTARVLHGACVRVRFPTDDFEEVGYSHNLSEGGIYVRTLAPFVQGQELWLELVAPGGTRRVHVEAAVVWNRVRASGIATVPRGFGARFTGGSEGDLGRLAAGYRALLAP
ncbi:MAG: PilZ domain-containing protein [Myxococcales bacterium]|nr:PilZ domain-containing protein [Myxococcales bacterium]